MNSPCLCHSVPLRPLMMPISTGKNDNSSIFWFHCWPLFGNALTHSTECSTKLPGLVLAQSNWHKKFTITVCMHCMIKLLLFFEMLPSGAGDLVQWGSTCLAKVRSCVRFLVTPCSPQILSSASEIPPYWQKQTKALRGALGHGYYCLKCEGHFGREEQNSSALLLLASKIPENKKL